MKVRNLFIALVIVTFISMSAFAAGGKVRGRNGSAIGVGPGAGDGTCLTDTTSDQTQQQDQLKDGSCDQSQDCTGDQTQQQDQLKDGSCDQSQDCTGDQTQQQDQLKDGSCGDCPVLADLTDVMVYDLVFMREEEKLARDVYLSLYDIYGLNIFANIAASEQKHMDAVAAMLDKYGIIDPVIDDSIGVFTSIELQELYDGLMATGIVGLYEALGVGITIEETDIADLEACLATEGLPADITRVYTNLLAGSNNHLAAFTAVLDILYPVEE